MRKFSLAAALVLVFAGACGDSDDTPPPQDPGPEIEDPRAYFGLEPCVCYEYRDVGDPSSPLRLGIAVENVSGNLSGGEVYHVVRYRYGPSAQWVRMDLIDPTDPDVLLFQYETREGGENVVWRMDPPIPLARGPLGEHDRVSTETEALPFGSAEPVPESWKVDTIHSRQPEKVWVQLMDEFGLEKEEVQVEAYPVTYRGLPQNWREGTRWYAPELGLVQLEFSVDGELRTWVLDGMRTLDGCSADVGDAVELQDKCGQ